MKNKHKSNDEWINIFKEFDKSTFSFTEFCDYHNIAKSTFYKKRKNLLGSNLTQLEHSLVFEPIVLEESDVSIEINGARVKANIQVIRSLLQVNV